MVIGGEFVEHIQEFAKPDPALCEHPLSCKRSNIDKNVCPLGKKTDRNTFPGGTGKTFWLYLHQYSPLTDRRGVSDRLCRIWCKSNICIFPGSIRAIHWRPVKIRLRCPFHGENIRRRKNDGRWEGRYKVYHEEKQEYVYRSVYGHTYAEVREKLTIKQLTTQNSAGSGLLHRKCFFADFRIGCLKSLPAAGSLKSLTGDSPLTDRRGVSDRLCRIWWY